MSQWGFVVAAYGLAAAGTVALVVASFVSMRRAESAVEELRRR